MTHRGASYGLEKPLLRSGKACVGNNVPKSLENMELKSTEFQIVISLLIINSGHRVITSQDVDKTCFSQHRPL